MALTPSSWTVLLDINQPALINAVAVRPYAAQYPQLGTIDTAESVANSVFNSLQASLRQRLWKGLSATANYTHGHSIDDTSSVRNTVPTDSYNLGDQRFHTFDIRHFFTGFVSYDVPQLAPLWPRLTAGWQLNSLFTFSTDQPINLLAGTNGSGTGENQDRVDIVGNPFASVPVLTGTTAVQYFNPAAFAKPAPGTFGNIGRDLYYGPGLGSVDFSVFRKIPVKERVSLECRAEILNLFNRTNWANPGLTPV